MASEAVQAAAPAEAYSIRSGRRHSLAPDSRLEHHGQRVGSPLGPSALNTEQASFLGTGEPASFLGTEEPASFQGTEESTQAAAEGLQTGSPAEDSRAPRTEGERSVREAQIVPGGGHTEVRSPDLGTWASPGPEGRTSEECTALGSPQTCDLAGSAGAGRRVRGYQR